MLRILYILDVIYIGDWIERCILVAVHSPGLG